ncbi:right-handed parallel beta-helix repeat-containing protein [uncultured Methanobrevibacter sp.]|uniref:right-handed parallel beta-helix repeat-containing protein n=1 Tax=uncultured Methanobrevibacter sp. TaxID=253161 RepID=UPI0025EAAED4|nr:right-handed parallel beta-helix repeat-containing protein [uncultured Methanobrevibacter sp.]
MKVNKFLLAVLSMFLILLLFVSSASAADANDTSDVLSVDESANILNNDTNILSTNNNDVESNENILRENTGSYAELATRIKTIQEAGDVEITLDKNCIYTYDSGSTIEIGTTGFKIDGNGATIDMAGSNIQAFKITNSNVIINNLTIKNVKFDGYGGAIYWYHSANGAVSNCNFINNIAKSFGGAIVWFYSDNGAVSNCTFINNTAREYSGGAIYWYHSANGAVSNCNFINNTANYFGGAIRSEHDIKVDNSTFIGNHAAADYGGAIYAEDSVKSVDSIFTGNSAYADGGAIYAEGNVDIKNTTFENNKAEGASSEQCYGGAIRAKGDAKVDNCSFLNNHAADYGGAIYADTITWVNTLPSYFIGNYVDDNCGGAIYTNKFNTDIYYGVFINNTAKANDDGGAIYINNENHLTIAQCYFENNRCGDEGGAIYTDSMSSSLKLLNNIFIDNDAGDKGDIVYNSGYYDAIAFNWFGINNPSFDNKFKEYHTWPRSDEDHSDGYPVHAKLLLDNDCKVGKEYNLTVYFEDAKGNHAILLCDLIKISISADNNAKISDWHKVSECTYVAGITFTNTNVTHITANVNNQVLELDVLATVNDFQHRHENASNSANVVTNNDYNVDNNGNTNLFSVISNVENADYTNSSNKTPNNSSVAKTIGNQSNGSGFNYLWVLLLIVIFAGAGVLIKQYKN